MKPILSFLFLLFVLAGCDQLQQVTGRSDVAKARAKWEDKGIVNYEFEVQQLCFCAFRTPNLVVVKNGQVTQVLDPATRQPREYDHTWFRTIPEWLDWIEEAQKDKPQKLEVSYDPNYGFPSDINYNQSDMIADEEFTATIRNFKAYN